MTEASQEITGAMLKAEWQRMLDQSAGEHIDPRTGLTGPALRMHQCVSMIASMTGMLGSMETRQAQADAHARGELAEMRAELARLRADIGALRVAGVMGALGSPMAAPEPEPEPEPTPPGGAAAGHPGQLEIPAQRQADDAPAPRRPRKAPKRTNDDDAAAA